MEITSTIKLSKPDYADTNQLKTAIKAVLRLQENLWNKVIRVEHFEFLNDECIVKYKIIEL